MSAAGKAAFSTFVIVGWFAAIVALPGWWSVAVMSMPFVGIAASMIMKRREFRALHP